MLTDKNQKKFSTLNLNDFAGLAIGLVDGKVQFKDKDPGIVMKRLLQQSENKQTLLICVPRTKTTMVI